MNERGKECLDGILAGVTQVHVNRGKRRRLRSIDLYAGNFVSVTIYRRHSLWETLLKHIRKEWSRGPREDWYTEPD